MRFRILFFILSCLIFSCKHSSQQAKDHLRQADRMMEQHPDSALKHLKAIESPDNLSSKDHALYALLLSQALDKTDIEIQSDSLIRIAVDYFSDSKDKTRAGYSYFYLSRCERNRGNTQGQAEALLKAVPYAKESKNHKLLGFIYGEKASIYKEQNQLDSMIYYYKLAYKSLEAANDQRNAIVTLINIGYGYYKLEKFQSGLHYFKIAEKEALQIKDSLLQSTIHKTIGLTYYYLNQYSLALQHTQKSMQLSSAFRGEQWMTFGAIFEKQGKLDSARIYLQRSVDSGETTPDCYSLLSQVAEQEKNYFSALKYARLTITAKDSANAHALSTSFSGMEKKYNYERIAAENKSLIIANQRNKIAVLFLLLGLSIIIVIVLLWRYRHKQLQLLQHQELVEKEKENNLLLQQQINMQSALLKNVEHHKKIAIKRLVPKNALNNAEEDSDQDSTILYDELISSIDALYNDFSKRLTVVYPRLTTTDVLICCLLRAGFESGMIASLLDTQADSFNVRRTRLRKKLDIRHSENLANFLTKF